MGFLEDMKARAEAQKTRATKLYEQAKRRVPADFQDFLLLLPQKVKLGNFEAKGDLLAVPGVVTYGQKTYVEIALPYVTVDGRVAMLRDEWRASTEELSIEFKTRWTLEAEALLSMNPTGAAEALVAQLPQELRNILTCIVTFGKRRAEGSAKIGWGGQEVDSTNPFENAETSALGRALGFLGYGLVGTGIASYEEVKAAVAEREQIEKIEAKPSEMPAPRPVPQVQTGDNTATPPPVGQTTNEATPPPTTSAAPASSPDDPALTQTEGPCADCGKADLMDKVATFVKAARGRGTPTRWSHAAIPSLGCTKAATIASKVAK